MTQTDGEREREIPERADYLRKQAASEEVGRPATLTGDSYTDLRRQDRGTRREGQIPIKWGGGGGKWRRSKMA